MSYLTEAPILQRHDANRREVMHAIAAMVLGRSCTVLDVEVRVTERRPDGGEHVTVLSGLNPSAVTA